MQMEVVSIAINTFLLLKNMIDGMERASGLLDLAPSSTSLFSSRVNEQTGFYRWCDWIMPPRLIRLWVYTNFICWMTTSTSSLNGVLDNLLLFFVTERFRLKPEISPELMVAAKQSVVRLKLAEETRPVDGCGFCCRVKRGRSEAEETRDKR